MKVISVRDLELYMRCPRAYKFKVINDAISQEKPLSLCKSITTKRVIFWMHENKFKLTKDDIGQQCSLIWDEELSDPRVNQQELQEVVIAEKLATKKTKGKPSISKREKLLESITVWCLNYHKIEKDTNVLHFNIPYECQIGDARFTGAIDLVRQNDDNTIEIVKLRTSSQAPALAFIERDISLTLASYASWKGNFFINDQGSDLQISIAQIPRAFYYHLPFLETYKRNAKNGKKGEVKGNPLIESSRSQEKLLDFEFEILQVVAGIEMNYFPMRIIQPCGCCLCAFRHQCESFVDSPTKVML
ncbi:PD-(D/E)XK nuclease family protein [Candidatus Uabimicrobium sp. HlEnr_7]|uniref:PD-(D/E)XK nuclease family protein n=1 Tax=Candidatus Uabimicrobium helgolandensis TaxID=3095367 RepID=UPI0035565DF5